MPFWKTNGRLKIIVICLLILCPFVIREIRISRFQPPEMWGTLPITAHPFRIIPTPPDTQGAFGMRACISPDSALIAVAGNHTDQPAFFDPFIFGNRPRPIEAQEQIKVFLKNIYWTDIKEGDLEFRPIKMDRRIRAIMAMAFSHSTPKRLAYISRETVDELPPNLGQIKPTEFARQVKHLEQEGYRQNEKTPFRQVLYVVDLPDSSPQLIATLETETQSNKGFIYSDMSTFSLCWREDDQGLYFKDGNGISSIALNGTQQRVYSLDTGRIFFSELMPGKPNGVVFIERNNIDVLNPPPDGGADELIAIDPQGKIISRRKLAEGYQWYFHLEGRPQGIIGNEKWAYAVQEFSGRNTMADSYLVFVGRLNPPFDIQPYRIKFDNSTMPFYCVPVGFDATETSLWLTKKFNLYRVDNFRSYQPDAPYSELIQLNID